MAGDLMWRLLHDAVYPADLSRQLLDLQMRTPRGTAQRLVPSSKLFRRDGENSQQIYERQLASHLVYLNNCMIVGGFNSFLEDPTLNPLVRFDPLQLVNQQREMRGLPTIGPSKDDPLTEQEVNKLCTYTLQTSRAVETYDIVHCRHTRTFISPDLAAAHTTMPESDLADVKTLAERMLPGEKTYKIALRPDFYDAKHETWMHRAIAFQEAEYMARSKKDTPSLPTCNGTLNECCECRYCLGNMIHTSDMSTLPTVLANVTHRQTLHQSSRRLLLAKSIIMSCQDCNFHFGLIQRLRYFQQSFIDNSFPFDLSTTTNSQFPTDDRLRSSDLFAKHVVRNALIGASALPPKQVRLKTGSGSSSSSARTTSLATSVSSASSSSSSALTESSLWDHLTSKKLSDHNGTQNMATEIFEWHNRFWQRVDMTDYGVEALRSQTHSTLSQIVPTGHLLREQYLRSLKYKPAFLNLAASILFPPCHAPSKSYTRHLHDLQNSVNADQGKHHYQWTELASKRHVFGSALSNPAHLWQTLVADAISIESYCIQYHASPETVLQTEPHIKNYYNARFAQFTERYGVDEVTLHKTVLEPVILKMYRITAHYNKHHGDAKHLQDLRDKNDGILPVPFLEDAVESKMTYKHHIKLTRLLQMREDILHMHTIAQFMAKEIELNLNDSPSSSSSTTSDSHSWDRVTTPVAAMMAFNASLAELTVSCYCNSAYRSMVGLFWPIPREYMAKPSLYIMNGMWEWYHIKGSLLDLVRDTIMITEHVVPTHSGDTLEQTTSQFHMAVHSQSERYLRFYNTITTLQRTEEGRAKFAAHDWQMDAEWMTHFRSDLARRFTGQVLDMKPMAFSARPPNI